jgi:hypothetical protein
MLSGILIARQSAAPNDEERDIIIEALNEPPETLINLNRRYCKPSDIAALSPQSSGVYGAKLIPKHSKRFGTKYKTNGAHPTAV